jgi:RimJ/RimL family protein N-acetyltransferase
VVIDLRGAVVLRDFRATDRPDFLAVVNDDAMFEFMKFRLDESTATRQFEYLVTEPTIEPRRLWNLVIESPEGEFTGWAGLGGRDRDDEAEFGWYLTSSHWGRGYATEATRLLVDFAFNVIGPQRLYATADPENVASCRVLEKAGLVFCGAVDPVQTWRGPRPRVMYELVKSQG